MTEREALNMALQALETLMIERGSIYDKAITAIKEVLEQQEPNYKKALEVWLDKTEWVQKTVKPHELGMHRADVLKQRIEEALAQPEQEPVACVTYKEVADTMNGLWGGTLVQRQIAEELENTMLYTTPPQRKPLTDEEIDQGLLRSNYAFKTAEAWRAGVVFAMTKLKEKNT